MSWCKNGMLLAAGGVAGLAIAAWLESEGSFVSAPKREMTNADGMEILLEKIRSEAEWAMDECTTDEQREKVYEEVKASVGKLQAALERSGEKIVTDLKGQYERTRSDEDDKEMDEEQILKYRSTIEKLLKDLDTSKKAKSAPDSDEISGIVAASGLTK
jgi:hypothetical protein